MSTRPSVAVVSGASSGLGAALVSELTNRRRVVIAIGRDKRKLDAVAASAGHCVAEVRVCDIGNFSEVKQLTLDLLASYEVEHLINAAGNPAFSRIADIDERLLEQALSANLRGLIYLCTQLVDPMKARGRGTIVGILSTSALIGRAEEAAYTAAKWGARGFLECLRADCKGTGVRVISVFPGGMNTPYWARQSHIHPDLESYMQPADVARAIANAVTSIQEIGYVSSLIIERG